MIPWSELDTATIPDGGELRLMRRGDELAIRLGPVELMNSRRGASEEALATLPCQRIATRSRAAVLIGGLGMGFTLRAALAALRADASIVVAELVPAVVSWARGPIAKLFGDCLKDPRVTIQEDDVGRLIGSARSRYDAILLDVDNGPAGLSRKANDGLYGLQGLHSARVALRAGGVLAVWSMAPDRDFTQRLRQAGYAAEEVRVRANGTRPIIWIATNGPAPARSSGRSHLGTTTSA